MSLLALDLGTKTGWAQLVRTTVPAVHSGTKCLEYSRYDGGGVRFVRFREWLDQQHMHSPIERVAYEAVRAHKGIDAAHVYGGLQATLTAWCEDNGIPYEGVGVGTIKKAATGNGAATKDKVAAAMAARGFTFGGHDETDALALLHHMVEGGIRGFKQLRP